MSETIDPKDVERVARAILAAENGLDGDSIGTMLHEDFRIQVRDGDKGFGDLMTVAKRAAEAAIRAMQPAPLPVVTPSAGWADGEKFAKE
jgi:hypothetical protein